MTDLDMLAAMGEIAKAVSAYTGVKQQFIDAGWTPAHAELMVIEMVRSTQGTTT